MTGLRGAGLGLRQALIPELRIATPSTIDFFELAPENWLARGGKIAKSLDYFTQRYPIIAHGLSLSLGGPAPLDETLLQNIKKFLDQYAISHYSEHLSYCSDDGHLYDLMPLPLTEEAVIHVSQRIRRSQEILQRRIAIENVSYYCAPHAQMQEIDFINAVLHEADCDLLLDINNVYVNSINHDYCAKTFLNQLPKQKIRYLHVAGHYSQSPDLLIDTHANSVCDAVWELLATAYQRFGVLPTLLERDDRFPPLVELLDEMNKIQQLQAYHQKETLLHV